MAAFTLMRPLACDSVSLSIALTVLMGLAGHPLMAQPTGGQVVAGSATISPGVGALTVTQTSARAIINWQDFSIAAGAFARFVQPDATSATLNRVVSGLPSSLTGKLEANGRIYLINPNGILVGAGARIDTAGFLASTLDVTNQEFLAAGDLHFTGGSTAAIRNLGAINALDGDVFLIARQVENSGTISAHNGTAGLAAGSEILLTTGGAERIFIQTASVPGAVVNSGTIAAASAELKAAGGNAFALAINNSGLIRATGTAVRTGQVWLVATGSGTISNSGTLDASSATGGGRILVLGGMLEGGRVMVGGTLDASSSAGDGGFIETSAAHVHVTDGARVTTAAPSGLNGTWLIDPVDFTIAATGGDMTGAAVGTALAGGNFTIQSTTGGTGTAGNVNVNDPVSWSANKLTLNAQGNINFNAPLNGSGTASLALEYGQGAVAAGNTNTYLVKAAISLPAGSNFSTKLGSDGTVRNFTVITGLGAASSTTATDLQGMAGNLAGLYVLGADIDATATGGWNAGTGFAPIGTTTARYTGTFDGLGHTVNGLTIARPAQNDVGLFGFLGVGGVLRNITLVGGSITGMTGTGALLGSNSGSVSSASASTTVSGRSNVGGLVGSNFGTLSRSWATGTVSNASGTVGFVGGLVGNNIGTVSNSWASGNVTATGPNAGGLVGFHQGAGGTVSGSYATGSVSGTLFVGGLTGSNAAPVTDSYATGSATGTGNYVGGLVGYNYSGTAISNTYATGSVSSPGVAGGLAGNNAGTISTSYWNSTSNATGIGGGTTTGASGKTPAEMMQMATFTGFNIASTGGASATWRIYEGNTTPWLTVFLTPLTATPNNDSRAYNGTLYTGGNGVSYSITSPSPTPSGTLTYGGTAQSALNAGSYTLSAAGLYSVQQGYDISYATGTLTINPANLTISTTDVVKTYDGGTTATGTPVVTAGTLFGGDVLAAGGLGASYAYVGKDVGLGNKTVTVAGLGVNDGNGGNNYTVVLADNTTSTINPATLTYTANTASRLYGATNPAFAGTVTGFVNSETLIGATTGTTTFGSTAMVTSNVGTFAINGSGLSANNGNYVFAQAAGNATALTINPADLTLSGTKLYNGTTAFAGSNLTATGVNGETFTLGGAGASDNLGTKNVQTGQLLASVTGLTLGSGNTGAAISTNYNALATAGSSVSVTAANLTISTTDVVKTYDGGTTATGTPVVTAGTLFGGDVLAAGGLGASYAYVGKDVGLGNKTVTVAGLGVNDGNGGNNYTVVLADNTTSTINPATLIYTANTATRVLGESDPAFSGSVTGFANGEVQGTATTGAMSFTTPATGSSPVGTYALNGSGLTANAGNYLFVQAAPNATAFTITSLLQVPLTITADSLTKIYGAALPTFTASYAGFINGDTAANVTGLQFSTTATMGSNTGLFTITPFGATAPAAYLVGYVPGTLTISPAALTLTANNATRLYGAANAAFSGTYTGLVNGDTPSVVTGLQFSTPATAASSVGDYVITPSGAVATNYALSFAPGLLTVQRRPLTLTALNAERIFGAINPVFSASFNGFVNGDSAASVSGLVINTTATPASMVGDYPISPSSATAANYTLVFVDGRLRITTPLVTVGTTEQPVVLIGQQPVLTPELAVILQGERLVLVPVNSSGDDISPRTDRLALTLGAITRLPAWHPDPTFAGSFTPGRATAVNFGRFELVAPSTRREGAGSSNNAGTLSQSQMNEPGLFRESSVNMGGFNIIYHESLADVRQQDEGNTSLGSSYREFSDTDDPQVNLVRAKIDRKPATPATGVNAAGVL